MWGSGGAYQDWARFIDAWADGAEPDPSVLPVLRPEDLAPETWVRLTDRLVDALDRRLRAWSAVLSRDLSGPGGEFEAARALTGARAALRSIRALTSLPGLPADLGQQLRDRVDGQVRGAQTSLEEQVDRMPAAGTDPRWVEARRRTVRENPLTAALSEGARDDPWVADPGAPPHRRVIEE